MKSTTNKLKPCPWCGSAGEIQDSTYGIWAVRCANRLTDASGHARCAAYGPERKTKKSAIAAWNHRVPSPAFVAMLEALKAVLLRCPSTEEIEELRADAGLGYRRYPLNPTPTDATILKWAAALALAEKEASE